MYISSLYLDYISVRVVAIIANQLQNRRGRERERNKACVDFETT